MGESVLQDLTDVALTFTKEMNDMEMEIRDNSLQGEDKQIGLQNLNNNICL